MSDNTDNTMNEKPVAVLGSPSDTIELTADILDSAKEENLLGSMLYLETQQNQRPLIITGQITEINLRNRWHEHDTMRNLIKERGQIPYFSGKQDTRTANITVGAVFSSTLKDDGTSDWMSESLGNVPSTGMPFRRITKDLLDELLKNYQEDTLEFGYSYGDDRIMLPMYSKHFGYMEKGGQGEAYHSLIVGKTGSGKSTLAKMMIAGYSRHKDMGILIIDPKGEFSNEASGREVGDAGLPLLQIFQGYGREIKRLGVSSIQLENWDIWEDIAISSKLYKNANVKKADNGIDFINILKDVISKCDIKLTQLHSKDSLDKILKWIIDNEQDDPVLNAVYKGKGDIKTLYNEIRDILEKDDHRFRKIWNSIASLFKESKGDKERHKIWSIVSDMVDPQQGKSKPIYVIDLSIPGNRQELETLFEVNGKDNAEGGDTKFFDETLQKKILSYVVDKITRASEDRVEKMHRNGVKDNANTLVVFDEAHRFVPSHKPSDKSDVILKEKLITSVRETRKYGLGWMFIDQTIGGIDKQITQQVRLAYFGFGLSMGSELDRLKELVGGDSRDVRLYQSFRDPASYGSGEKKRYPWMAVGPVSPMSSMRPLFFNALSGEHFVDINNLPLSDSGMPTAGYNNKNNKKKDEPKNKGVTFSGQSNQSEGGGIEISDFFKE